ncbi:MAG: hypothetical protein DLM70_02580 [Chloroflexi bacterium]|nr:MAG: hypothetical protein DLM70_02580 [Chloroflexota bacterium]
MAKGPDFYAPLTIRIIGAGGERTFDANGGLDGDAAWNFVQQVEVYVAGQSVALPPQALSANYEIDFRQDSTAVNRLPWYGTPTAQFFYYQGRGSVPSYVRLHMARTSEPVHDTWLLATPSLTDMVQRHLQGLQPVRPSQPRPAIDSTALGFGLLVALALLAGAVLIRRGRLLAVAAGRQANTA